MDGASGIEKGSFPQATGLTCEAMKGETGLYLSGSIPKSMKKTTSYFLFAALLVGCLFACQQTDRGNGNESDALRIAFVNGDSILFHFQAFREASDALDAKQRQLEADLQKKGAALEQEIIAYQQKAQSGTLTGKEMQAREKYLAGRQESILAERDKLSQEFMQETALINDELKKVLDDKLAQIQKEEDYDYILNKAEGGSVLMANEAFDITDKVLKLLNEEKSVAPAKADSADQE